MIYSELQNPRICDIMVCAMARLLHNGETVFHGVSSHMPLVATMLAKAIHAPELVHLNIPGGVNPRQIKLTRASSAGANLITHAGSMLPLQEVFDLSMRGGLDVAFLSGIQFDASGNVNASVIGDYRKPKVRMPGGAGSAVLIPTAKRALIWRTKHDLRTFVNRVDFVTTRGNIDRIVTPLCIFRQDAQGLVLDSIHPTSSLEELQKHTAFPIRYSEVRYTEPPTKQELAALRRIDPEDLRGIEL